MGNFKNLGHLFLLLIPHLVNSAPHILPVKGSRNDESCDLISPNGLCYSQSADKLLRLQPGTSYQYNFDMEMSTKTNIQKDAQNVKNKIDGHFSVSLIKTEDRKNENCHPENSEHDQEKLFHLLFVLDKVSVNDQEVKLTESNKNIKFVLNEFGKLYSDNLCFVDSSSSDREPNWLTNLKRGLISHFQNNFLQSGGVYESDVHGEECKTRYTFDGTSYSKVKKMTDCKAKANEYKGFRTNEMLARIFNFVDNNFIQGADKILIKDQEQKCEQSIDGHYKNIHCTEKYRFYRNLMEVDVTTKIDFDKTATAGGDANTPLRKFSLTHNNKHMSDYMHSDEKYTHLKEKVAKVCSLQRQNDKKFAEEQEEVIIENNKEVLHLLMHLHDVTFIGYDNLAKLLNEDLKNCANSDYQELIKSGILKQIKGSNLGIKYIFENDGSKAEQLLAIKNLKVAANSDTIKYIEKYLSNEDLAKLAEDEEYFMFEKLPRIMNKFCKRNRMSCLDLDEYNSITHKLIDGVDEQHLKFAQILSNFKYFDGDFIDKLINKYKSASGDLMKYKILGVVKHSKLSGECSHAIEDMVFENIKNEASNDLKIFNYLSFYKCLTNEDTRGKFFEMINTIGSEDLVNFVDVHFSNYNYYSGGNEVQIKRSSEESGAFFKSTNLRYKLFNEAYKVGFDFDNNVIFGQTESGELSLPKIINSNITLFIFGKSLNLAEFSLYNGNSAKLNLKNLEEIFTKNFDELKKKFKETYEADNFFEDMIEKFSADFLKNSEFYLKMFGGDKVYANEKSLVLVNQFIDKFLKCKNPEKVLKEHWDNLKGGKNILKVFNLLNEQYTIPTMSGIFSIHFHVTENNLFSFNQNSNEDEHSYLINSLTRSHFRVAAMPDDEETEFKLNHIDLNSELDLNLPVKFNLNKGANKLSFRLDLNKPKLELVKFSFVAMTNEQAGLTLADDSNANAKKYCLHKFGLNLCTKSVFNDKLGMPSLFKVYFDEEIEPSEKNFMELVIENTLFESGLSDKQFHVNLNRNNIEDILDAKFDLKTTQTSSGAESVETYEPSVNFKLLNLVNLSNKNLFNGKFIYKIKEAARTFSYDFHLFSEEYLKTKGTFKMNEANRIFLELSDADLTLKSKKLMNIKQAKFSSVSNDIILAFDGNFLSSDESKNRIKYITKLDEENYSTKMRTNLKLIKEILNFDFTVNVKKGDAFENTVHFVHFKLPGDDVDATDLKQNFAFDSNSFFKITDDWSFRAMTDLSAKCGLTNKEIVKINSNTNFNRESDKFSLESAGQYIFNFDFDQERLFKNVFKFEMTDNWKNYNFHGKLKHDINEWTFNENAKYEKMTHESGSEIGKYIIDNSLEIMPQKHYYKSKTEWRTNFFEFFFKHRQNMNYIDEFVMNIESNSFKHPIVISTVLNYFKSTENKLVANLDFEADGEKYLKIDHKATFDKIFSFPTKCDSEFFVRNYFNVKSNLERTKDGENRNLKTNFESEWYPTTEKLRGKLEIEKKKRESSADIDMQSELDYVQVGEQWKNIFKVDSKNSLHFEKNSNIFQLQSKNFIELLETLFPGKKLDKLNLNLNTKMPLGFVRDSLKAGILSPQNLNYNNLNGEYLFDFDLSNSDAEKLLNFHLKNILNLSKINGLLNFGHKSTLDIETVLDKARHDVYFETQVFDWKFDTFNKIFSYAVKSQLNYDDLNIFNNEYSMDYFQDHLNNLKWNLYIFKNVENTKHVKLQSLNSNGAMKFKIGNYFNYEWNMNKGPQKLLNLKLDTELTNDVEFKKSFDLKFLGNILNGINSDDYTNISAKYKLGIFYKNFFNFDINEAGELKLNKDVNIRATSFVRNVDAFKKFEMFDEVNSNERQLWKIQVESHRNNKHIANKFALNTDDKINFVNVNLDFENDFPLKFNSKLDGKYKTVETEGKTHNFDLKFDYSKHSNVVYQMDLNGNFVKDSNAPKRFSFKNKAELLESGKKSLEIIYTGIQTKDIVKFSFLLNPSIQDRHSVESYLKWGDAGKVISTKGAIILDTKIDEKYLSDYLKAYKNHFKSLEISLDSPELKINNWKLNANKDGNNYNLDILDDKSKKATSVSLKITDGATNEKNADLVLEFPTMGMEYTIKANILKNEISNQALKLRTGESDFILSGKEYIMKLDVKDRDDNFINPIKLEFKLRNTNGQKILSTKFCQFGEDPNDFGYDESVLVCKTLETDIRSNRKNLMDYSVLYKSEENSKLGNVYGFKSENKLRSGGSDYRFDGEFVLGKEGQPDNIKYEIYNADQMKHFNLRLPKNRMMALEVDGITNYKFWLNKQSEPNEFAQFYLKKSASSSIDYRSSTDYDEEVNKSWEVFFKLPKAKALTFTYNLRRNNNNKWNIHMEADVFQNINDKIVFNWDIKHHPKNELLDLVSFMVRSKDVHLIESDLTLEAHNKQFFYENNFKLDLNEGEDLIGNVKYALKAYTLNREKRSLGFDFKVNPHQFDLKVVKDENEDVLSFRSSNEIQQIFQKRTGSGDELKLFKHELIINQLPFVHENGNSEKIVIKSELKLTKFRDVSFYIWPEFTTEIVNKENPNLSYKMSFGLKENEIFAIVNNNNKDLTDMKMALFKGDDLVKMNFKWDKDSIQENLKQVSTELTSKGSDIANMISSEAFEIYNELQTTQKKISSDLVKFTPAEKYYDSEMIKLKRELKTAKTTKNIFFYYEYMNVILNEAFFFLFEIENISETLEDMQDILTNFFLNNKMVGDLMDKMMPKIMEFISENPLVQRFMNIFQELFDVFETYISSLMEWVMSFDLEQYNQEEFIRDLENAAKVFFEDVVVKQSLRLMATVNEGFIKMIDFLNKNTPFSYIINYIYNNQENIKNNIKLNLQLIREGVIDQITSVQNSLFESGDDNVLNMILEYLKNEVRKGGVPSMSSTEVNVIYDKLVVSIKKFLAEYINIDLKNQVIDAKIPLMPKFY